MKCSNDYPIVIAPGNEIRGTMNFQLHIRSVLSLNSKEQCSLGELETVRGTLKDG